MATAKPNKKSIKTAGGVTLLWFRQDLRLVDNPALVHAAEDGAVLPVYIHDPQAAGDWALGSASLWWLHHSLTALAESLAKHGLPLILRTGNSLEVLRELIAETGATGVTWNRRYEPWAIRQDTAIKETLREQGLSVDSFNARLLNEPWEIKNGSGTEYKVFTPYWKACLQRLHDCGVAMPSPVPKNMTAPDILPKSDTLESWGFLPTKPDWSTSMTEYWLEKNGIGERAAQKRLKDFIDFAIEDYTTGRDFPGREKTSRLSPHLAFGEIGPRQVWHGIRAAQAKGDIPPRADHQAEHFLREIGWREFCYHLLYHFPQLPDKPLQAKFAAFPWRDDPQAMTAWQQGKTGIPIVDAGMRQLWQTGWMHNRVRMIVGSLLVKNLLLPWRDGETWFWDTLVDADLANNAGGWQWIGGCGADAAPYFRIFNPVLQSERFDPEGAYIRHYVPELAKLPDKYIHAPFTAPADILAAAGVTLGKTYPKPLIDLKASRDRALEALKSVG